MLTGSGLWQVRIAQQQPIFIIHDSSNRGCLKKFLYIRKPCVHKRKVILIIFCFTVRTPLSNFDPCLTHGDSGLMYFQKVPTSTRLERFALQRTINKVSLCVLLIWSLLVICVFLSFANVFFILFSTK